MSEIKLIFIRHGEAANAWGNHPDPGLSDKGILQAKNLIKHDDLQDLQNYSFISSPKLRAIETAKPLANRFNKKIELDKSFIEIPAQNIALDKKQLWLKEIIDTKKDKLPQYVKVWNKKIFDASISAKNNSIIFTHFMVINALISELTSSETLLYFYPDYTSVIQIIIKNQKIESFLIEGNKKTYINL
tara:strand:+ start:22 stop:585 length:564 start_codon:yes stop_codon:yes gene_type:complete